MSEEEAKRLFEEEYDSDTIFEDLYYGEYDSEEEYAREYVEGMYNIDLWLECCIDWECVCNSLRMDRNILIGDSGKIYVFRE